MSADPESDEDETETTHVFLTRVENTRHGVSVGFDERSAGFVWFFSFLVWFSQMEREYGDKLVILLNEPGLSLHGTAQADLLRYIKEKLLPQYQVIYSTHSPFMIDAADLFTVRTGRRHRNPRRTRSSGPRSVTRCSALTRTRSSRCVLYSATT